LRRQAAKENRLHYYNTIGTLKQILQIGVKNHKDKSGVRLDNPAFELKRTKIRQKDLQLPKQSQFRERVINFRKDSGGWGPRIGDLVEFLACRNLVAKLSSRIPSIDAS